MEVMQCYVVRAERAGGFWDLRVPEVPGAMSMVRRLDQAEEHIREAIGFVLDVPEDSFEIELAPLVPSGLETLVGEAKGLRAEAERAVAAAASASRSAAEQLRATGLPMRDIGVLMNISVQRVSQLLGEGGDRARNVPTAARAVVQMKTTTGGGQSNRGSAITGRFVGKTSAKKSSPMPEQSAAARTRSAK